MQPCIRSIHTPTQTHTHTPQADPPPLSLPFPLLTPPLQLPICTGVHLQPAQLEEHEANKGQHACKAEADNDEEDTLCAQATAAAGGLVLTESACIASVAVALALGRIRVVAAHSIVAADAAAPSSGALHRAARNAGQGDDVVAGTALKSHDSTLVGGSAGNNLRGADKLQAQGPGAAAEG